LSPAAILAISSEEQASHYRKDTLAKGGRHERRTCERQSATEETEGQMIRDLLAVVMTLFAAAIWCVVLALWAAS
jgi:hypothetical protein